MNTQPIARKQARDQHLLSTTAITVTIIITITVTVTVTFITLK
jgi:hypothetical protein